MSSRIKIHNLWEMLRNVCFTLPATHFFYVCSLKLNSIFKNEIFSLTSLKNVTARYSIERFNGDSIPN